MAAGASWLNLDTNASTGAGQRVGLFDKSGWVINMGSGDLSTATAAGGAVPPWVYLAAAGVAVVWLLTRNR